jgi:hypothetical protein
MGYATSSPSPPHSNLWYDPKTHTDYISEYEPEEPEFNDEEPEYAQDPDDPEHAASTAAQTPAGGLATDDPDAQVPLTNGAQTPGRNIVEVNTGDGPKKSGVVGLREKRIDDDKRSTTPYMTKYERARVLGTRALQIRYVRIDYVVLGGGDGVSNT